MRKWIAFIGVFLAAFMCGVAVAGMYFQNTYKNTVGLTDLVEKDSRLISVEMLLNVLELMKKNEFEEAEKRANFYSGALIEGVEHNIIDGAPLLEQDETNPKLYSKVQTKSKELVEKYNQIKHITN